MPVIAVAIAALPAVAVLLVVVTRMETMFFGDGYDRLLGDSYRAAEPYLAAETYRAAESYRAAEPDAGPMTESPALGLPG